MIRLDHVNVVVPPGRTEAVVPFYEVLGLVRVPKPPGTSRAAGAWFDLPGGQQVHVSERSGGRTAEGAAERHPEQHLALAVDDLDGLVERLRQAGHPWEPRPDLLGRRRGMTADPEGNAVELLSG